MAMREDLAATVRTDTLALLDELTRKAREFQLPTPLPAFEQMRQRLADNRYCTLVVGEAKRGKSSLVNALIGRSVLPTDVAIATCQVFRVSHAETGERFRLRFADGSTREIAAADLQGFGSQQARDRLSAAGLDLPGEAETLHSIEVACPLRALPPNVSVLDTPGLGSLYAAHAEITYAFVPEADGVIFVLDSLTPIQYAEINFLQHLLQTTSDILFVQTKIDAVNEKAWRSILQRNEQILRERFGNRLGPIQVVPISSHHLRDALAAADADDAAILRDESRHGPFLQALEEFLFRVAGWRRCAQCQVLAADYQEQGASLLGSRLAAAGADTEQSADEADPLERLEAEVDAFDGDWGLQGGKRQAFVAEIQRLCTAALDECKREIGPDSPVVQPILAAIDGLASVDACKAFLATLSGSISSGVLGRLEAIRAATLARCHAQLAQFANESRIMTDFSARDLAGDASAEVSVAAARDRSLRLQASGIGIGTGEGLGSLVMPIAAGLLTPALGPIALVVAAFIGARQAALAAGERQLDRARADLRRHTAEVTEQIRRHFFDGSFTLRRPGRLVQYYQELERSILDHVGGIADKRIADGRAEIARIGQARALAGEARAALIGTLAQQEAEWTGLNRRLAELTARLGQLTPPSAPDPSTPRNAQASAP